MRDSDIEHKCRKLGEASKLCDCKSHNNKKLRGPYLALISMSSDINKENNKDSILRWVFEKIKLAHDKETEFTNLIGLVGVMGQWSIFKARSSKDMESSRFVGFTLEQSEEHFVLKQILTGILSVFYDASRRNIYRPGYTAFHRKHDIILGEIKLKN